MAEQKPDSGNNGTPARLHWRLYAAIAAGLTFLVAVSNGVVVFSKLPSSIAELQNWIWPGPEQAPVSLTVVKQATKPPPGFELVRIEELGEVFGGGADIRLVLQSSSAERVAQVVRLVAKVKRIEPAGSVAIKADPLAQPGFGAARPQTFLVAVQGENAGTATYVRDAQQFEAAAFPDLLPAELVYWLGGKEGPQETIDLKLRLQTTGFYEITFAATIVSESKEYVVESEPVRVGRT